MTRRMLFPEHLVVVRGGGDLGTGVVLRLHRSGFPVVVTERASPLTIRRTVAVSSAVERERVEVEGMEAERVSDADAAVELARRGTVPVLIDEGLPPLSRSVVVDARMAKAVLDTSIADAPLVVALGPGFVAGRDCHAVVETARGHHLGRVLWEGSALADTGTPGEVGGRSADRVVRAPAEGQVRWKVAIGDIVEPGQLLGSSSGVDISAPFAGVVRGLIAESVDVHKNLKIADVDPRSDTNVHEVSEKALAIGGGVVEAVLTWLGRKR